MTAWLIGWCCLPLLEQVRAQPAPPPCSEPEAGQFDFWLGEWQVLVNGKEVGRNRISRIHGGCTLLEEYTTKPNGFEGRSFNYYEPGDGLWHQVWVDNSGTRLHLKGSYAEGRMVLSGPRSTGPDAAIDRITWHDLPDGTVRQVWEISRDEGQTWQVLFDGLYRHP